MFWRVLGKSCQDRAAKQAEWVVGKVCRRKWCVSEVKQSKRVGSMVCPWLDCFNVSHLDVCFYQRYALSFVRDPASHPLFEGFFSKRWFHTLSISLRNFLSTVLDSLPLPKMLAFNQQRLGDYSLSLILQSSLIQLLCFLERKANLQEMRSLKAQVNGIDRAKHFFHWWAEQDAFFGSLSFEKRAFTPRRSTGYIASEWLPCFPSWSAKWWSCN